MKKAEFIEFAPAWKSRNENSTICSGPLSGTAKMIMSLPLDQDARLMLQHNDKKGDNEKAPDYRFILVVSPPEKEESQYATPTTPTDYKDIPF